MITQVKLTFSEIQMAGLVGMQRHIQNLKRNTKPAHGAIDAFDWQMNIEGALAECALAKHFKLFWSKGETGDGDVGDFQVRSSRNPNSNLIIHPKDHDDKKYYLLTGGNGEYIIRGYIYGIEGKAKAYWSDPTGKNRHAYFVPQSDLKT